MLKSHKLILLSILSVVPGILNCSSDTGTDVPSSTISASASAEVSELQKQLVDISSKLDDLNNQIKNLKSGSTTTTTSTTPATVTPTAKAVTENVPSSTATIKPTTAPVATATPASSSATPKEKGRLILNNIINAINNAGGIIASVDKYEKNLKTGDTSSYSLKFTCRKSDYQTKIEVLNSSNSSSIGVKMKYTSGHRDEKVKIRPSGALSLITTDLPRTDERIASANGFLLDDTDFYGMAKRFADTNYEAELTGITKLNGTDVYLLKITCKTANSIDARIKYENIGFEAKTYNIRTWEAFDGVSQDAFYRLQLSSISYVASIPDSSLDI